jgi:Cys-rich protein (TIGR01571 family)
MCCAYWCLVHSSLCWIPHYFQRIKLREKYGLEQDSTCPDLPAVIFCGPCALCQEARFLKHNGILESYTRIINILFL